MVLLGRLPVELQHRIFDQLDPLDFRNLLLGTDSMFYHLFNLFTDADDQHAVFFKGTRLQPQRLYPLLEGPTNRKLNLVEVTNITTLNDGKKLSRIFKNTTAIFAVSIKKQGLTINETKTVAHQQSSLLDFLLPKHRVVLRNLNEQNYAGQITTASPNLSFADCELVLLTLGNGRKDYQLKARQCGSVLVMNPTNDLLMNSKFDEVDTRALSLSSPNGSFDVQNQHIIAEELELENVSLLTDVRADSNKFLMNNENFGLSPVFKNVSVPNAEIVQFVYWCKFPKFENFQAPRAKGVLFKRRWGALPLPELVHPDTAGDLSFLSQVENLSIHFTVIPILKGPSFDKLKQLELNLFTEIPPEKATITFPSLEYLDLCVPLPFVKSLPEFKLPNLVSFDFTATRCSQNSIGNFPKIFKEYSAKLKNLHIGLNLTSVSKEFLESILDIIFANAGKYETLVLKGLGRSLLTNRDVELTNLLTLEIGEFGPSTPDAYTDTETPLPDLGWVETLVPAPKLRELVLAYPEQQLINTLFVGSYASLEEIVVMSRIGDIQYGGGVPKLKHVTIQGVTREVSQQFQALNKAFARAFAGRF